MASKNELKSAYEAKHAELKSTVESVTAETKIDGATVEIPESGYNAVKSIRAELAQMEDVLKAGESKSFFEDWAQEGTEGAARFAAPIAQYKSVADVLFESDEYKDMIDNRRAEMRDYVKIESRDIVAMQSKDVWSGIDAGTSPRGYGIVHQELPFVEPKRLTTRVRDLFPAASTTSNLLEYFRSVGWTAQNPNGAATVAERTGIDGTHPNGTGFGLKPKSSIAFTSESDPIKTIAHWVAAHRNALSDRPQLRSIIDNELLYGLALVEDDQLLNGDGQGDNILGLLNRTGIQHYDPSMGNTGDQYSDTLRRALTRCELAFFPSTGFVLHPLDWEELELQKDNTGGYMLVTNVAAGAQKRAWQVPVVSTPAIAQGTFLTGAFGQAAQVYDREEANIRVSEHHEDLFARNAVAVLAEERLGLTTQRPEGMVVGSFEAPTP